MKYFLTAEEGNVEDRGGGNVEDRWVIQKKAINEQGYSGGLLIKLFLFL